MPILKLKPHILEVLFLKNEYEDDNGDYHKGISQWVRLCNCDAVPAGQANQITLPDGTTEQYSYTLYLPKIDWDFLVGDKVRVIFQGKCILPEKREFVVKGFHAYQHQCKLWV